MHNFITPHSFVQVKDSIPWALSCMLSAASATGPGEAILHSVKFVTHKWTMNNMYLCQVSIFGLIVQLTEQGEK